MGNVITAVEVAHYLDSKLFGENIKLNDAAPLNKPEAHSILFSKTKEVHVNCKCLVLVPQSYEVKSDDVFSVIKMPNPRLAYAQVIHEFFFKKKEKKIHSTTIFGVNGYLGKNISVGANCYIGDNVTIGENSVINHNVVIADNTTIGENCYIKSGTIIGEDGFGFDFEDDGTPIKFPHMGKVVLGDNVEIGAKCTIARGTLDNTFIGDHVKVDDQVHIGHNCTIKSNTIITACAEISGSVTIGHNCWIGPNSSIIQKIIIGDKVTVGIGSIITSNIKSGTKIMGLEGLSLRELVKVKKRIKYGE